MNMLRHPAPRPGTVIQSRSGPGPARPAAPAAAARPAPRQAPDGRSPEARAAAAAASKAGRADDLFMVIRQLSELLVKENLALKRYRTDEVKSLAERKEHLAALYQSHMFAIRRDPSAVGGLDAGKRGMLAQLATRLAELMRDNASMLKANIQSIDTFFQAVNDSVREREERKSAAYSRDGMMNSYLPTRRLAVSYNQTT
jgi:hypothetical protein